MSKVSRVLLVAAVVGSSLAAACWQPLIEANLGRVDLRSLWHRTNETSAQAGHLVGSSSTK